MKKVSLATRVLALLKGGDESKLIRFESKVDKFFTKQIAMRKESIANLEEKIIDAQEALNDTVVGVDIDRVNTTEGADSYVTTYVRNVQAKEEVIANFEEQIAALEAEIAKFETTQATIYSVDAA
jgi:TPP-dependent trihydroxycyclohexane-1,2-dione (THcHDO) dehydratase